MPYSYVSSPETAVEIIRDATGRADSLVLTNVDADRMDRYLFLEK
jgi:hypothetical protein